MIPTVKQYDALERAVAHHLRVAIRRRGTEYLVVARGLRVAHGRESIEAVHPATGHWLELFIDEIDSFEVVE